MRFVKRQTINRAVAAALAISAVCRAATLHVPADHATIQACIGAAVSGVDECVVARGTYHEKIDFFGKAITARSSHGAAQTTIDGTGLGRSVVRCISNEGPGTVLDGFTVTGGTGTDLGGGNGFIGGGIYNFNHSGPWMNNCTLSGNTAAVASGGMYSYLSCTPTLNSCIYWGNIPSGIAGEGASVPAVQFSDVQFGLPLGAVDGGGNINLDPMFMRPPDPGPELTWNGVDDDCGDLRLGGGSPCINAGEPGSGLGMTDLEGHARLLCGRVDMGAYESGIGDYNCDQIVNLTDFGFWPSCMTDPVGGPYGTGCEAFDFDGDGDIDLRDFARFPFLITIPP